MSKLQAPFRVDHVGSFLRPKELVEAKMNWYVEESTRQCKLTLNEIVTKAAAEKIKSILC